MEDISKFLEEAANTPSPFDYLNRCEIAPGEGFKIKKLNGTIPSYLCASFSQKIKYPTLGFNLVLKASTGGSALTFASREDAESFLTDFKKNASQSWDRLFVAKSNTDKTFVRINRDDQSFPLFVEEGFIKNTPPSLLPTYIVSRLKSPIYVSPKRSDRNQKHQERAEILKSQVANIEKALSDLSGSAISINFSSNFWRKELQYKKYPEVKFIVEVELNSTKTACNITLISVNIDGEALGNTLVDTFKPYTATTDIDRLIPTLDSQFIDNAAVNMALYKNVMAELTKKHEQTSVSTHLPNSSWYGTPCVVDFSKNTRLDFWFGDVGAFVILGGSNPTSEDIYTILDTILSVAFETITDYLTFDDVEID